LSKSLASLMAAAGTVAACAILLPGCTDKHSRSASVDADGYHEHRCVDAEPAPFMASGRNGMVASDSHYASLAGIEILQAGGNAVDAAVATSFALGVTRPYSTGLGGGGFLIARFADGRLLTVDYRETAPSLARADMYDRAIDAGAGSANPSRYGYLAVAVPGLLAGQCEVLELHGTMPLRRVLQPAIRLAESGYAVDENYVTGAENLVKKYEKDPTLKRSCAYVYRQYLGSGNPPKVGDRLCQPELARLLKGIGEGGADFFYRGPVASAIERVMKEHGGLVTADDLSGYRVKHRRPIVIEYRDYQIIAMPPPSSGGIALAESLNILESVDLRTMTREDPVLAAHYRVEAMKHAFADRARWLGDDDFADVPVQRLTSKAYARRLASMIRPDRSVELDTYGCDDIQDDSGTSHFCVVDRFGSVVVATETINTVFGSLAAVPEWGLILNNEMDDFAARPGEANIFGLVQSDRNAIAPHKRPLSSMSPTIVLKDSEPFLLLGASGGPRIISSVLNVLLNVTDCDMPLDQAILARRPHHQWRPNQIYFDDTPPHLIEIGLRSMGHDFAKQHRTGVVQAILLTTDGWCGASDPRKGGRPAGY